MHQWSGEPVPGSNADQPAAEAEVLHDKMIPEECLDQEYYVVRILLVAPVS